MRTDDGHVMIRVDINDAAALQQVLATHQPDAVMHLAAESHVDRSTDGPAAFIQTKIVGTSTLLEAARRYHATLDPGRGRSFLFHHISADEVCGALWPAGSALRRNHPLRSRSPYSASKAASDHLVGCYEP